MAQRYMVTMTHAFPEDDGKWVRAEEHDSETATLRKALREIIDLSSGHRPSLMSEPSLRHEISLILDAATKAMTPNAPLTGADTGGKDEHR